VAIEDVCVPRRIWSSTRVAVKAGYGGLTVCWGSSITQRVKFLEIAAAMIRLPNTGKLCSYVFAHSMSLAHKARRRVKWMLD